MPSKLSTIKAPRDIYFDIVRKEISKLKSGFGLTADELAIKCGISLSQFRSHRFWKTFKTKTVNKTKYFVR